MKHILLAGIALMAVALSACDDETLDIGNTLTMQSDKLIISSADYNVTTRSVLADSILLRSSYCYLGKVKDPETGAYITSEFMTQFNILETFSMEKEDRIVSIYDGMAGADSCRLELYMDDPTGVVDTLAAMKIRVSELERPMEENRKYYSNYDPVAEGLIRKDGLYQDKMFSYEDQTVSDSLRALTTYYDFININLNKPYTDKNGVVYNNYGTYVMQQYLRHPEYFKNSYAFNHNVCPGFYVSVTDGEGVYIQIPDMGMRIFYTSKNDNDSVVKSAVVLAGTEEVLQTTKITNEKDMLEKLVADNTCTYMKAPAGLFTEVTLPIDDIYRNRESDSIMTAKISFQRINNDFYDEALKVPSYMLMVPKDSLHNFFENKKIPDSKMTFYATYTSNTTNQYTFSNISSLITGLDAIRREGLKKDANWVANHPDWNKVLLVPVQIITSSSSTALTAASSFEHCVGIASTKLVGGSANPYEPIKVTIVYGKFSQ